MGKLLAHQLYAARWGFLLALLAFAIVDILVWKTLFHDIIDLPESTNAAFLIWLLFSAWDRSRDNTMYASLPYSRRQLVFSRYVAIGILVHSFEAAQTAIFRLAEFWSWLPPQSAGGLAAATSSVVDVAEIACLVPFLLRFGGWKGLFSGIGVFAGSFVVLASLGLIQWVGDFYLSVIHRIVSASRSTLASTGAVASLMILMMTISYFVSLRMFARKDLA